MNRERVELLILWLNEAARGLRPMPAGWSVAKCRVLASRLEAILEGGTR